MNYNNLPALQLAALHLTRGQSEENIENLIKVLEELIFLAGEEQNQCLSKRDLEEMLDFVYYEINE